MTVNDFVKTYNGDLDQIKIEHYVPITTKMAAINSCLDNLFKAEDKIIATYNSVSLRIASILTAVSVYTDLEATALEDYDLLEETGLLDVIFDYVGPDLDRYMTLFNMRKEDYIREMNSIDKIGTRLLEQISKLMDSIDPKVLTELMELFNTEE